MHNTALIINLHKSERDLLHHFLADAGYNVLSTRSSDEALALCRDHKQTIDLLVTDADLPGSSGWELAEHAAALRPGIVILDLSGNSLSSDAPAFARANMLLNVTEALIHKTQLNRARQQAISTLTPLA